MATTEHLSEELSDQDRVLLVFGYLGPLVLVSLVAGRREFVKWHAKQGLLLSAVVVALYIILKPLHLFFEAFLWAFFGDLFWVAAWLVALGIGVLGLVCIVRGLEGERFKIPVLGDLADRL
ncbi:MAG: DUF4870 domain-containing protein [bacterium]|nr:DUF4870 domain-containing protein [bacterium]